MLTESDPEGPLTGTTAHGSGGGAREDYILTPAGRFPQSDIFQDPDLEQYRRRTSPQRLRQRPGSERLGLVRKSIALSASAVPGNANLVDGGSLAWKHAVCGLVVIFNCWGINLSFGVFLEYYVNWMTPELSQSRVAWIGSVQLGLMFILAIPIGRAFDRGWCRGILIPGALLMCAGQFLLSICHKWWELFLVQAIMMGTGMGMVFITATLCLATYFKNDMGVAMSVGSAGSSLGGIIYTCVARQLLRHTNFQVTCLAIGGIMLGTMIPPCIIFKPSPGRPRQEIRVQFRKSIKQLEPSFIFMVIGMFLTFMGLYYGFYFIIVYAVDSLGLYPETAGNLVLVMFASNLVGRFLFGYISERIGPVNTMIPCALFVGILLFIWISAVTLNILYTVACIYGLFASGPQILFAPIAHSLYGTKGSCMSVRMGLVMTAVGGAAMIGPPITGWLMNFRTDLTAHNPTPFYWAQVFAGAAVTSGAACFMIGRLMLVDFRTVWI
ncbi:MFS general substrate transporter [Glonium stellatum]|uniref:MFS general substrate transporter n=1 Tax=Glonium stellatum TaxID=574774 RepID=A0A8E2EVI2_9PEZI|nr:MFS general substrate transporter [Glonium stellatum]